MVFGYGGFLGLSSTQYKLKLKSAKLDDLKKQEVVKIRAPVACLWSVASGIGWAHFTCGGSLIVSGIGVRKWRVAKRKLRMIRAELAERHVPVHKRNWKDVVIPLTACAAGTAAGAGIDVGIGSLGVADFGGAHLGASASTALERGAGQLVAQEVTGWTVESFEERELC